MGWTDIKLQKEVCMNRDRNRMDAHGITRVTEVTFFVWKLSTINK